MRAQNRYLLALSFATIVFMLFPPGSTRVKGTTLEIGINENMFTVNGATKFLVFASYFDAMDVTSTNLHNDFHYLKANHVDGVRILPNWWDVRQDVWGSFPLPDILLRFR
jgi:hypothetical protein